MENIRELREIKHLVGTINRQLDAAFVKLGRLVVAIETVNESYEQMPSKSQLEEVAQTAERLSRSVSEVRCQVQKTAAEAKKMIADETGGG